MVPDRGDEVGREVNEPTRVMLKRTHKTMRGEGSTTQSGVKKYKSDLEKKLKKVAHRRCIRSPCLRTVHPSS